MSSTTVKQTLEAKGYVIIEDVLTTAEVQLQQLIFIVD
jgi:hypothetical protein